jgi:hypothetical protein
MPTKQRGFGKTQPRKQPSQQTIARNEAAKQFDNMKASGNPEFEIYIRIQGKRNWYPVGVIAVKRSSQINQAIFGSLEDLHQGAFRIYPILRKNQQHLEYGYRLKEFKDEPIQLAVRPQGKTQGLQNAIAQVGDRVSALFKRG